MGEIHLMRICFFLLSAFLETIFIMLYLFGALSKNDPLIIDVHMEFDPCIIKPEKVNLSELKRDLDEFNRKQRENIEQISLDIESM